MLIATLLLAGCAVVYAPQNQDPATSVSMSAVHLSDPVEPQAIEGPATLTSAGNEWTSFIIQISRLPNASADQPLSLRVNPLQFASARAHIDLSNVTVYQVLPMPVDVNRAGFVRQTGLAVSHRPLPRALLPIPMTDGKIAIASFRDPAHATDPSMHVTSASDPVLLWIDLLTPADAPPGQYASSVDLLSGDDPRPLTSVAVQLTVFDFVLPDARHLVMASRVDWTDLQRLYPDDFEAITPSWMSRNDPTYARPLAALDALQRLAQENRTEIIVPELSPVAKWPSDEPPQISWSDFDSVIAPWMNGSAFADRVALGFWPLAGVEGLENFDPQSQLQYWSRAASHFAEQQWLTRSAILPEAGEPGRPSGAQCLEMSAHAAEILSANSNVQLMVPMQDDQLRFAGADNPNLIDPATVSRLWCASPGLVFDSPIEAWPENISQRPRHWLRTDMPGLAPYLGAGGDERDARLWAWLAYLRRAQLILWGPSLPETSSPTEQQDPGALTWFYPGQWFGVDGPIPSVQLKWLRRAQQDFEYLYLAEQRGMQINALLIARLMTKQVELQPNQAPDPTYGLLTGSADVGSWEQARQLVARAILLRAPGQPVDPQAERALNLDTLRWELPKERPFVLARSVRFTPEDDPDDPVGNWLRVTVGIDIYNASDSTPDQNSLQWDTPPADSGWQVHPQEVSVPPLQTFRVQRFDLGSRFNLEQISAADREPLRAIFTNGNTSQSTAVGVRIPIAQCDRREGGLVIDGKLGDWNTADAIQDGPLVKLYDRPTLQRQEMALASTESQIFTGFGDENLYLAFRVQGITQKPNFGRNFVETEFRRAWGEDLCEALIQPIYLDGATGDVLHLVCKPNGVIWVERGQDPRTHANPWAPLEGSQIRYAETTDADVWRGELAIPWSAISPGDGPRPALLRFNFVQHKNATGESASWAGPIDYGRDESMMGLLVLRDTH